MSAPRYRPIPQSGTPRPPGTHAIAGGITWFDRAWEHRRGDPPRYVTAQSIPDAAVNQITAPRAPLCGLTLDRPRLMGVLNVTPDSFSDSGRHARFTDAVAHGLSLLEAGADILDIGGESTRPGANPVAIKDEIARVVPVIAALRAGGVTAPVSIDTRNAAVAHAAIDAGADIFNDVSALTHDPDSAGIAVASGATVCLMHAKGSPETMQAAPRYDDVLWEVYDYLEARIAAALAADIARERLIVDPGIGFGKTIEHNLALIRGLSFFHGLGCAILVGASRKRFIGGISGEGDPAARAPGSIAVALECLRQGAQVIRVHDVAQTRQAVALWQALNDGGDQG
jgi:dihydropteroate synthase